MKIISREPTSVQGPSFGDNAPELWRADLNVLPITPETKSPPKGCGWRRWQNDRQGKRDLERLRKRFGDTPGVAVVLGGPKRFLVDVDTDTLTAELLLYMRNDLPVPETAYFVSPHGAHNLYETAERLPRRISVMPDVDFLGSGIVVVPPTPGRKWVDGLDRLTRLSEEWVEFVRRPPPVVHHTPHPQAPKDQDKSTDIRISSDLPVLEWVCEGLRERQVFERVAAAVGVSAVIKRDFRCPWHPDQRASAGFCVSEEDIILKCFVCGAFSLPEVYAARITSSELRRISGASWVVWAMRLLHDAGVLRVDVPTVGDVPDGVKQVLAGWKLLLALKRAHGGFTEPTSAFAHKFAAKWCGVSDGQAWSAIRWMRRNGILVPSGQKVRRATLYRIEVGQ